MHEMSAPAPPSILTNAARRCRNRYLYFPDIFFLWNPERVSMFNATACMRLALRIGFCAQISYKFSFFLSRYILSLKSRWGYFALRCRFHANDAFRRWFWRVCSSVLGTCTSYKKRCNRRLSPGLWPASTLYAPLALKIAMPMRRARRVKSGTRSFTRESNASIMN